MPRTQSRCRFRVDQRLCGVSDLISVRTRQPEDQNSNVSDGSTTHSSAGATPASDATGSTNRSSGVCKTKLAAAVARAAGTVCGPADGKRATVQKAISAAPAANIGTIAAVVTFKERPASSKGYSESQVRLSEAPFLGSWKRVG
jgi:hypothetical protein